MGRFMYLICTNAGRQANKEVLKLIQSLFNFNPVYIGFKVKSVLFIKDSMQQKMKD